ncbi:sortase-dependent protein [Kitasatospora sp. NPDC004240]
MTTRTTRSRAHRAGTARRLATVCALTGAALLATVPGGQAWADGSKPATPTPTAVAPAPAAGSGSGVGGAPTARPAAASPTPAAVAPAPSVAAQGNGPGTAQPAPAGGQPQVREVPKGAAQAGDGSTADDSSGFKLAAGGAVAAVGAGALGFAVLRRRSGARG